VSCRWPLALLLGSLLPCASCISRTTPLPPPEVSSVSAPDDAGRITVSGLALEGASIGVINERTMQGVITSSSKLHCENTCEFQASLDAQGGDTLRVWQFFETDGLQDVPVPSK
jgi:hypothetical protein